MFKLSPITFVVTGLILIAVIWAGFWWLSIGPGKTEIGFWEEQNEKLDKIISPASQKKAQERVLDALETVQRAEIEWKQVADTKTPSAGRMSLITQRWQTVVNARRWHATVEQDLRRWIARNGVRVIAPPGGPFVPYPTSQPNDLIAYYFNYPALPFPVAIWDLGQVTVQGTYTQVINNVRSWNKIPGYIASVRGVSLEGTGNTIRATYGLTVLAYVNTPWVFAGPAEGGGVPDISQAAAPAGAGTPSGTEARPDAQGGAAGAGGGGGVVGGAGAGGGGGGSAAQARVD